MKLENVKIQINAESILAKLFTGKEALSCFGKRRKMMEAAALSSDNSISV